MATVPELISYIRQQTQEGVPAQELRVVLMEAGWNERDIENALHDVAAGLQPVTAGASIHEDLAQVRGMVAHLAARVKTLEARLTGQPVVPGLPTGTIGPERELTSGKHPSVILKIVSALADVVILTFVGWYLALQVSQSDQTPRALFAVVGVLGAVLLAAGYRAMRRRHAWAANLLAASSIALWSIIVWHAWQTYHLVEHATAIGLYVLLFVLLVVMGRWIDRLSR